MQQQFIHFVINHWMLWALFVVIALLLIFEELKERSGPIKKLSPQDLVLLINREQVVVVDLRDRAAFDTGHIIDAIHIPASEIETSKKLNKNKTIVLVNGNGEISAGLINKLVQQGFSIHRLAGGMPAWRDAGLPVQKK